MRELEQQKWILPTVSWGFSLYFLVTYFIHVGFSNPANSPLIFYAYLCAGLFFCFLPFFSKVKIGKLLELERAVRATKEEVKEFKSEVRDVLSIVSTNVNTIGNVTNSVTINLPQIRELVEAKNTIPIEPDQNVEDNIDNILDELTLDEEDYIMALARTRIRLEYLLRDILKEEYPDSAKVYSLPKLYKLFFKRHPEHKYLEQSFDYVRQICNAAIHAQGVTSGQAREALEIGARLIALLDKHRKAV